MHPIDFWGQWSKVKVTGALNVKMISADYLEKYSYKVFIFHIVIGLNE
jgi:hypothetical protein